MRSYSSAFLVSVVSLVLAAAGCEKQQPATADSASSKVEKPPRKAPPPKSPAKRFTLASEIIPEGKDSFGSFTAPRLRKLVWPEPSSLDEKPEETAPPLSLTASDGSGLELVSMEARAVVQGPLAFTELHLTFRNPEPRQIEGRFAITLPAQAAISRLAMKLPAGWQEAEVVERQAARRAYEDVLHRRQDPALLEKKAGNEFRARIFPIPPKGLKEIKLSYSQPLDRSARPYRLPLRGLPRMQQLKITAFLSRTAQREAATSLGGTRLTQEVIRVDKKGYKPETDFEVQPQAAVRGLRHGNLVVARFKPEISTKKAVIKGLLVLVDTSASRAAGFEAQVRMLGQLLARLGSSHGAELPLQVTCFDQGLSTVYDGPIGELSRDHLQSILARRALGASDLHGALRWAATAVGRDRLLLVTDGVATAGKVQADRLREAARGLRQRFKRIDAVMVGGIRDEELLRKLVRGTLEQDGATLDGDRPAEELARRLGQTTVSGLELDVPGARWVWPSRLDGLQPGDEVLVFADLPPGKLVEGQPVTISISGPFKQKARVALAPVKKPLLHRAWVQAQIERLGHLRDEAGSEGRKQQIDKQIVALSTDNRVLCDLTALLVLETESDYERYGIDRKALAEILTVGATGIELLDRKKATFLERPEPPDDGEDDEGDGDLRRKGRPPAVKAPPAPRGAKADRAATETLKSLQIIRGLGSGGRGAGPAEGSRVRDQLEESPAKREVAAAPAPPRAEPTAGKLRVRSSPRPAVARSTRPRPRRVRARPRLRPPPPPSRGLGREVASNPREKMSPYSGRFAMVMKLLKAKKLEQALSECLRWRGENPGDVLALVALGETLVKLQRPLLAARVYGSIIDLFPSRADMRRFAGQRLESLGAEGLALAADSYSEAVRQRPDHPNSHRMLAYALLRLGRHELAFDTLQRGLSRRYPADRFRGVDRIMEDDLGLIAAAWIKQQPGRRGAILERLRKSVVKLPSGPSLRFLLSWETDANDVDFHIHDGRGGHAFYSSKDLPSGGSLYADVTTGYGPECFTIEGKPAAWPYKLQIHYYSRGPMGYGMGRLLILQHDGEGGLKLEHRPFVVMNDGAFVDLGVVRDWL